MNTRIKYIPAETQDSTFLTEQAIRSKQYWGYPDELMDLWQSDLTVGEDYVKAYEVVKVFDRDEYVGFYAIKPSEEYECYEIDHLWLLPEKIGHGYGKIIVDKIKDHLRSKGEHKLVLVAEPNANGFYHKMGGQPIGKFQSKVSGRYLDIIQIGL